MTSTTSVLLTAFPEPDGDSRRLADAAVALLNTIVNDGAFLDLVGTATYGESPRRVNGTNEFPDPSAVRAIVTQGHEPGKKVKDHTIRLRVALEDLPTGVSGDVKVSPTIRTDTDFFGLCLNRKDAIALAALWMHEWLHVSGFRHRRVDIRDDVPYVVDGFVRLRAQDLAGVVPPETARFLNSGVDLFASPAWNCPMVDLDHKSREPPFSKSGKRKRRR